ncbi:MAG: hypothetical protein HY271_00785 [Deltaproteobacteria bacterium]|nr:hypothetical protein [Deltaproteobacteria bacterium]
MPVKGLVEKSWRLDASDIRAALGRARGASAAVLARRPDGGEPLRIEVTPMGGTNPIRVGVRYTIRGETIDDHLFLMGAAGGWFIACALSTLPGGCPRRGRAVHLPPTGRVFGCRKCMRLGYTSQRQPLAARIRAITGALARCEAHLASADPSRQCGAVRDARRIVRKLLAASSRRRVGRRQNTPD